MARSLLGTLMNKAPVPYVPSGMSWPWGRTSGTPQMQALETMGSVGTLFSIVSRISQDVAKVRWHLYRTPADARRTYSTSPSPRQEVFRHPALQVWNRPNPFMPGQEFRDRPPRRC